MKKSMKVLGVSLALAAMAAVSPLFAAGEAETAAPANTFAGKNVRVVIGSTSTAGDSYLIAETVSRHLAKALGANLKVDAVGAAVALDAMQTSKPDGNTIMMFHDMTYLGVSFKAYDDTYKLENMVVGPRIAQNPVAAWATYLDAPYNNMVEVADYLKANSSAVVRFACEAGGVSHIGFISFYEWVKEKYGQDVASRVVVVIGGSTGDKIQKLIDRNADVIFADYTSLLDYTKTTDKKIAMKFTGLLDNVEGVSVPSYADLGITGKDGKPFRFSKDFLIYLPKNFPADLLAELDAGMATVSADPQFKADLGKMSYRPAYLNAADAKKFIYGKRDSLQSLIDAAPSLDDLVQQ
jgi:tripartite-type tricarboxylate transporter receptor subunit TctC